ncbi:YjbH domain-containing protein [uncultured Tateyamaria sp.]|uniref:YjbH domain-containing protein n=1 Tax=uncultured Tateyamaria sp. TaxID=455651 RepID=UPI00261E7A2B|nr:YjbH domain-containing protein [uncultured Tateyamaria sp.]
MKLRCLAVLSLGLSLVSAGSGSAQTLSLYGTPGLVDMPTAQVLPDGNLALTTNRFGGIVRNTLAFQLTPRIYGTFRYSINRDFFGQAVNVSSVNLFDRSFDLHYQLGFETDRRPGFAVGLRDFGGTGVLSGEYVVATKGFADDRFRVTAGLGWGRLAQRGGFTNPLGIISDQFETRPTGSGGGPNTGNIDIGQWFRGEAALFGGIEYQATDRLSFQLEYSSDAYNLEAASDVVEISSPINIGLNYTYPSGSSIRAFLVGGREIGFQYSFVFDPAKRRSPGGFDKAPEPILGRDVASFADMELSDRQALTAARKVLGDRLTAEGIDLEGLNVDGGRATVRIQNNRWDIEAQAIGRTARAMANTLPSNIDTFVIIPQARGVANSAVTLQRADLEELDTNYDGAWLSLARARIDDAPPQSREGEVPGIYPKFSYGLGPYTAFSFFDPNEPLRYELGAQLSVTYAPLPGLSFDGLFRQPLTGNIDDATRQSNSVIQRVRSDSLLYAQQSDFEINRLTAEYMWRPGEDLFARVTGGYLENMFAGVSGELLWYPIDSRLAMGLEINYAKQRDFDMLFGLQDYDVITGHASAYYDLGKGYITQIDAGRYLAGDWGATFSLDREFNNGFKVGGYFTLTDVSFDDFGEGSFDKGIRFTVPVSWLTGIPSRAVYSETIQPVLRDGGARLNVANRLYGVTRDYRAQNLSNGWGRIFR